jgi:hypothetical protein
MPKIKTVRGIENRKVVSQKDWLVARKKLLVKEKSSRNCATGLTFVAWWPHLMAAISTVLSTP